MRARAGRARQLVRSTVLCVVLAAGVALAPADTALADFPSYIHVVRPGETLASIAQRYYGDPRREGVLVAENGLGAQGGSAIVVGMRLVIPWVGHHTAAEGETWNALAERFYGDARRVFLLLEVNEGTAGAQPDVGSELLIPYPLRHVAGQTAHLRRIANQYFGTDDSTVVRRLRRFNNMRGMRPARGSVVLIPLSDLVLSEEGRHAIEEVTGEQLSGGEARAMQQRIDDEIPRLREHVRRGRYTEAISLGNRLLGAEQLTGNQIVSIQRELATGYVAVDREDLAVEAFVAALSRQADLELDIARTSPTVLRPFDEAKARRAREMSGEGSGDAGAGGGDSGVSGGRDAGS